jgi:hypothetical protein
MYPSFTIKLRKWIHLFIRRLEQFKPTKENIDELFEVFCAIGYIYLLKRAESGNPDNGGAGKETGDRAVPVEKVARRKAGKKGVLLGNGNKQDKEVSDGAVGAGCDRTSGAGAVEVAAEKHKEMED